MAVERSEILLMSRGPDEPDLDNASVGNICQLCLLMTLCFGIGFFLKFIYRNFKEEEFHILLRRTFSTHTDGSTLLTISHPELVEGEHREEKKVLPSAKEKYYWGHFDKQTPLCLSVFV